jgi:hypothetical protein
MRQSSRGSEDRELLTLLPDLLTFNRGAKDDFDRVAEITKDEGWSSDQLQKYFLKVLCSRTRTGP